MAKKLILIFYALFDTALANRYSARFDPLRLNLLNPCFWEKNNAEF